MISDGLIVKRWLNSLRWRMMLMMTLALFPIGLIAVIQTNGLTKSAREAAELSLLLLTEQAALTQRLEIQRAMGSAKALTELMPELADDHDGCVDTLSKFQQSDASYGLIGILPNDGHMRCASSGRSFDFTPFPEFYRTFEKAKPSITVNIESPISGKSEVIVSHPYFDTNDKLAGIVMLSLPHDALPTPDKSRAGDGLINLVTLNPDGMILTASAGRQIVASQLPKDFDLAEVATSQAGAFSGKSVEGTNHIYAVVPIKNSPLSVLGIWTEKTALGGQLRATLPAGLFPALMWSMSMAVALFAVHRLVTRHIKLLGRQMAHFAANRRAVKAVSKAEMPTELRDIQDSFLQMAVSILHDEARLEDAVREKNVLLREIHHRVKNNLQLISSIVNMQIRNTPDQETKRILRRIQDRVLSLATIHRDLYQTSSSGRVNVGHLVKEIVEKSVDIAVDDGKNVDITTDISDVFLYPDQAVPLSLLASEAATNAMKYLGAHGDDTPYLTVSLARDNDGKCDFVFENSVGGPTDAESSGLGAQLMNAFAIQLGAKVDIDQTKDVYRIHVSFVTEDFEPEPVDY